MGKDDNMAAVRGECGAFQITARIFRGRFVCASDAHRSVCNRTCYHRVGGYGYEVAWLGLARTRPWINDSTYSWFTAYLIKSQATSLISSISIPRDLINTSFCWTMAEMCFQS